MNILQTHYVLESTFLIEWCRQSDTFDESIIIVALMGQFVLTKLFRQTNKEAIKIKRKEVDFPIKLCRTRSKYCDQT